MVRSSASGSKPPPFPSGGYAKGALAVSLNVKIAIIETAAAAIK
jgi:hypothetical protein